VTAATTVIGAHAADPNIDPQYESFAVSVEAPPPPPVVFRERFDSAFENNVNGVFLDRLQPLNIIEWNLQLPGKDFADNLRARAASGARSAFVDSIEYGARDAVADAPLIWWLDERNGWFADLLRGSIDNVAEESVSPLSLSYQGTEQSWWHSLLNNGGTHYGIRPFRTSPYAYVSHGITDGEKTLLLANVRYYYDRFANHRFELALSLPVAYGMMLDLGSAYEFGVRNEQQVALKLLKELKGGGVVHFGIEVRERPMLIAGISFGW
jgi:hypothetical protein